MTPQLEQAVDVTREWAGRQYYQAIRTFKIARSQARLLLATSKCWPSSFIPHGASGSGRSLPIHPPEEAATPFALVMMMKEMQEMMSGLPDHPVLVACNYQSAVKFDRVRVPAPQLSLGVSTQWSDSLRANARVVTSSPNDASLTGQVQHT